ncbi:hypothetical protein V5O48_005171 [Marasmius crinis-equi]|uniref:Uncharacterized protein n=1 Tax=Marasmius crinis-equi TaxID=585013 RepID=A0ABR3FN09_9AGAR
MVIDRLKFYLAFLVLLFIQSAHSYEVPVLDTDYDRQICSGMWASEKTFINGTKSSYKSSVFSQTNSPPVTFDASSQGQLAMVIYEWTDAPFLGKVTSTEDEIIPQKTYICTTKAAAAGFCTPDQYGHFILDLPTDKKIDDTSFWAARVELPATRGSRGDDGSEVTSSSFWDNPEGNPTPPPSEYDSPWKRNPSPEGIYHYTEPIQYLVRKTGYYCVAIIPFTVKNNAARQENAPHPSYTGTVLFRNKFDGKLPATDYPKVNFYFAMFLVYATIAAAWGWLCYKHVQDILPLQYYLSGLVGLLVIEMVANWGMRFNHMTTPKTQRRLIGYYRYLNAHGRGTASTVFLIVVAILDAGRNSMSFFMLLVVCLGLSVVRESLERTMLKCQALAGAHFIFGILYAIGIVELELESTSGLVLLLFVIPLAFTLSGFLLWIMYALNATITELRARKQRYKLRMFEKLNWVLMFSVCIILIFFIVSSFSFSGRLAEDIITKITLPNHGRSAGGSSMGGSPCSISSRFPRSHTSGDPPRTTEDESLSPSLLEPLCLSFSFGISTLAMSEELAQDEADAEDYDMEALESSSRRRDDDEATLVGGRGGHGPVANDDVVFEIGDDDDDDQTPGGYRRMGRPSGERRHGEEDERKGLISSSERD